jgi:hypothetical protein
MQNHLGSHGCPFLKTGGSRSESHTRLNVDEVDESVAAAKFHQGISYHLYCNCLLFDLDRSWVK